MALAHTCDVCGRIGDGRMHPSAIHAVDRFPLPEGWRYVNVFGDVRTSIQSAEVCSLECAEKWITEHFADEPSATELRQPPAGL